MKKTQLLIILIAICMTGTAQNSNPESLLLPAPVSFTKGVGNFKMTGTTAISIPSSDAGVKKIAEQLVSKISTSTGFNLKVSSAKGTSSITFVKKLIESVGKEGYTLTVTSSNVTIAANNDAGLFYGMQSFLQLLPADIESKTIVTGKNWIAPACSVTDYPRFGWRGLMFDVSRHFYGVEDVKAFIDQMVKYKYNLLHMHLTDDEGWRIEIKGLPRLTEVGAYNVKKVGYFGTFSAPGPDEPKNYGGFYTQDDIRALVKYAKDRFVDILPEIDVPGHSLAAVVSYPELSCTPGADKYRVRSGEEIMDWSHGAPPIALVDNTLCPANEKVYEFLDKVMTQVAQLFPFEYIHVGGDECPKNYWEKSDAIKALMQKENLKNYEEVQSYFEKRLEKIVESKGKKFMGWDEILEGGLAPSAAVMSWRGMKGGIEAAKIKHDVVMSPTTFAYLDYMQADPVIEPRIYASLRLNKAYQFEPVPEGVDPKYIKGGQGNLWTEQIYNIRTLQYMLWPRAMAIGEKLWSPKTKTSWNSFFPRVEKQFDRFNAGEIKYSPAVYDPIFKVSKDADKNVKIEITTEIAGFDIYYSFDNSFPDKYYPKYTGALTPPKDAVQLKVITYRDGKPIGRLNVMPAAEWVKRSNGKVSED